MINSRDELLRLMLSKNVTLDEFNFDQLTAPPIEFFISKHDLDYLVYLANSPKFSSKINFKYDEIDKLMKARGFVLLGRGTNRVVYRSLEYYDICLKIAIDHIGSSDNPKEFINQEYLKPYVSKIFSVDPTGTIAVAERVHPISTREEFQNYGDAIYDLITKYFIGRYVVNDIGTKYFMNWGIRYSTSMPVLLDYPYFYLFDPRKAVCHTILEDGTVCNGDIDYDDGYNILFCTKCGRHYKAAELAKEWSNDANSIVTGGNKMKAIVSIKKGSTIQKVVSNPETKKLEDRYSYSANVSIRTVKQTIDNVVEENTLRENASSSKGKSAAKSPVKAKKVAKVSNDSNIKKDNINKNKFVQKGGNNKPKPKKKRVAINTGSTTIVVDEAKLYQIKSSVKVAKNKVDSKNEKSKDNIVLEDNINTKDSIAIEKIKDAVEKITSAEDETSVINEDGVHVEDESHVEDEISPEETEINTDDMDSEEIVSEMIVEGSADEEAIREAIDEETDDTIDSIDSSEYEEEVETTEEEDQVAIQEEYERLMEEKETTKKRSTKKSSKDKFDPDFYGKTSRRKSSKSKNDDEDEE